MTVNPLEFVAVMAPCLLEAAALAAGTHNSTVIHKPHERVAGSESEPDRASRVDVLSELDLRVQEMLLEVIFKHWPFVNILAEEDTPMKARFAKSSDFYVLIDPIDGTRNFVRGDQHHCHIVSLVFQQDMLVTLLYSHVTGQLFVAVKGEGTSLFLGGGRRPALRMAVSPSKILFHHVSRIPPAVLHDLDSVGFRIAVSRQNATDILTLLEGEASGFISFTPLVYDVWSPGMIIQEAGGWVSDWLGRPLVFDGHSRLRHVLIAASPGIAAPAIEKLSRFA